MKVPVTVFSDAVSLGEALAAEIADGIVTANDAGCRYVLGCPGGRSPRSTYQALTDLVSRRHLDLSQVVIAMMDDYVVPAGPSFQAVPDHLHFSCRRFAADEIVSPLNAAAGAGRGIAAESVWFPDPTKPADYDYRLSEAGGVDLFIVASGASDGHVAFNPPGTTRDARSRVVSLAESTRRDNLATFPAFGSLAEVPGHGVTVGVATIAELSARVVLLAEGEAKAPAIARVRDLSDYEPSWPASIITLCRNPSIYADLAAAGLSAPAR
jgi:glucosamine-6-phosphate deaminase